MAEATFRIVAGASDWGSPLSELPLFDNLEEAQSAARKYVAEQKRRGGGQSSLGKVVIEETKADGSVVSHAVS